MHASALGKAIEIARKAHAGQKDKLGNPFLSHLERVALKVGSDRERTVAYLHDVVEKGAGWSLQALRNAGFDEETVAAIDAMTRRPNETYMDFVQRSLRNPLARRVKRADLEDNLGQMELKGGDGGKYQEALALARD